MCPALPAAARCVHVCIEVDVVLVELVIRLEIGGSPGGDDVQQIIHFLVSGTDCSSNVFVVMSEIVIVNASSGRAACFAVKEGAGWISAYETSMIASLFSAVSFLVTLKEMTPAVLVSMSVIQLSLHLQTGSHLRRGFRSCIRFGKVLLRPEHRGSLWRIRFQAVHPV